MGKIYFRYKLLWRKIQKIASSYIRILILIFRNKRKMTKKSDIDLFPIYDLNFNRIPKPKNWNSWYMNLHHFIKKQSYDRNPEWYRERNIKQKLFFIPVQLHLDIHNLSDNRFKAKYGTERSNYIWIR